MNAVHSLSLSLYGIDINGLDPSDGERISQIGIEKWMDGIAAPELTVTNAAIPRRPSLGTRKQVPNASHRRADYVREGNGRYCSAVSRGAAMAARRRSKE